jgi:hypothetical protein
MGLLAAVPSHALPPAGAKADTSQAAGILGRLRIHPDYTSSYSVNRTSRQWDQGFQVSREVGPFAFKNNWSLNQRRDEAQSNLRSKRGQMGFKADYGLGPEQIWTIGVAGTFKRDSQLSTRSDQVENRSDLALAMNTKLPELMMHRVGFLKPFNLNTGADVGYGADRSVSRRSARRDSTWVNGLIQHYEAGMTGAVGAITLSGNATSDLRTGDSKTRQRDTNGLLINDLKDKTDSRSRHLDGEIQWRPVTALSATVTSRWVHEVNQYWDIQANNQMGGQESKDGRDVGSNAVIEWKPSESTKIHGELGNGSTQATYKLQNKDFKKKTVNGRIDGSYVIPSFAGPLRSTELQAAYSADEARNVLEDGVGYRQANRRLRVAANRKLGRKLQASMSQEMSLLQYFYEDGSNDRDERRIVTDGVLNYYPSSRFSGYFNLNLGDRKAVNIPGTKAINNSTNQSYRVSTQISYSRGLMRVEQQYTVQADYIYYQFQKGTDALVRTNSVLTTLTNTIWKRIGTGLQHEYQFTESGRYIVSQSTGRRAYTPSQEETRQLLSLSASYPFGILRVDARQLFELRRSGEVKPAGVARRIRETRRGEFSVRGELEQKFSNTFSLRASFQKTQSITERGYWTVRASVQKGF